MSKMVISKPSGNTAVFGPLAASEPDNPELVAFLVRILLQFV